MCLKQSVGTERLVGFPDETEVGKGTERVETGVFSKAFWISVEGYDGSDNEVYENQKGNAACQHETEHDGKVSSRMDDKNEQLSVVFCPYLRVCNTKSMQVAEWQRKGCWKLRSPTSRIDNPQKKWTTTAS